MIRGRLGMAMLALGVIPMAIPSRPSPELDLRAAERAIDELTSAGINAHTVLEISGGPERFVATASVCVANKAILAEHGHPGIVDVEHLLGRTGHADPDALIRLVSGRLAKRAPSRTAEGARSDEVVSAALHPCGHCRCGGQGKCQWCRMNAKREAAEAAAEARHREVLERRRARRSEQKSARRVHTGNKARRGYA